MKRLFISFFIISFAFSLSAQAPDLKEITDFGNNEIRLNVGSTAFAFPEINYERAIGEEMGFGIAAAISLVDDYLINYQILPFYRMYFSSKKMAGFFVEVNFGIVGQEGYSYKEYYDPATGQYHYDSQLKKSVNVGFGVAAGYKFLNRRAFVAEAFGGLGRLLGDPVDIYVYPRVGISIGKRF